MKRWEKWNHKCIISPSVSIYLGPNVCCAQFHMHYFGISILLSISSYALLHNKATCGPSITILAPSVWNICVFEGWADCIKNRAAYCAMKHQQCRKPLLCDLHFITAGWVEKGDDTFHQQLRERGQREREVERVRRETVLVTEEEVVIQREKQKFCLSWLMSTHAQISVGMHLLWNLFLEHFGILLQPFVKKLYYLFVCEF